MFCGDFLQFDGRFDRIVMNPPFADGQDVKHVIHAYGLLSEGGRLVSIMSPSWRFNSASKFVAFREWLDILAADGRLTVEDLPAGTFKESGTDIATVIVALQKSHKGSSNGYPTRKKPASSSKVGHRVYC